MMEGMQYIYEYSRRNAIADGVLVDVSHVAKEYGIALNTVFTAALFVDATQHSDESASAGETNVHAVFLALKAANEGATSKTDTIYFKVLLDAGKHLDLWAKCHPGDAGEPVITIMRADED